MQSLKLRVWVIFIFRQTHQVVGGHPVKFRQCCDGKGTDVLFFPFVIPQRRLRQTGLRFQLFQCQVLIDYP